MQLVVKIGEVTGKIYRLEAGQILILGRDPSNQIIITDSYTSRTHALLEISTDEVTLTDLNSTRGTFVNNRQIMKPVILKDGDIIRVGKTFLAFEVGPSRTWVPRSSTLPVEIENQIDSSKENPENQEHCSDDEEGKSEEFSEFEKEYSSPEIEPEMASETTNSTSFINPDGDQTPPVKGSGNLFSRLGSSLGMGFMKSGHKFDFTQPGSGSKPDKAGGLLGVDPVEMLRQKSLENSDPEKNEGYTSHPRPEGLGPKARNLWEKMEDLEKRIEAAREKSKEMWLLRKSTEQRRALEEYRQLKRELEKTYQQYEKFYKKGQ